MKEAQAKALVGLLEAGWMPLPESKFELYLEELRAVDCAECALVAVRTLIREVHFLPAVADLLVEYAAVHPLAHRDDLRALPDERWTDEDREAARQAGAAILRDYRARREDRISEEATPAELVAAVVERPAEQLDPDEIERQRRDALANLEGRYGDEIEAQRAEREAAAPPSEEGAK